MPSNIRQHHKTVSPPETKAEFEQFWSELLDRLDAVLETESQEQEQKND